MTRKSADLDWQLLLNSTPRQVFCALVTAACEHGRLISVENFGTAVVFAPPASAQLVCTPMRATVVDAADGTLVRFCPTGMDAQPDTAAQAESVGSLIRQMRRRPAPVAA